MPLSDWPENVKDNIPVSEPRKNEVNTSDGNLGRLAGDPPDAFGDWLDGRLKTLYEAVLTEPLPAEMLELLAQPRRPRRKR